MCFAGYEQIVSAFLSNSHSGSSFSRPWWEGTLHRPLQNLCPGPRLPGGGGAAAAAGEAHIWWAVETARPGPEAAMILSLLTSVSQSLMAAQNWTDFFFLSFEK